MAKQSITDFKSEIKTGFARSNLFRVQLSEMNGTPTVKLPGRTSFLIKAASLPASNIGTIAIPYNGRVFNVPGDRTFEAWSTTIMNTESFKVRRFIESWIKDIQDIDKNYSKAGNYGGDTDYTATLDVYAMDRGGGIGGKQTEENLAEARHYKFHNAFPSALSAIDLDFASNDAIEEFTCEWQYSHWTVEK